MIEYNLTGSLRSFEQAFSTGCSGCVSECDCGKVFYDSYNTDYDWEDGEFEALEKNDNAYAVDHSVGSLTFRGKEYVSVCDCWHEEAKAIIESLTNNAHAIAAFLSLEKKRASEEAAQMPTVEEGWVNMASAPKDGREIEVTTDTGRIVVVHFAQDLSGEEQPSFSGFFEKTGDHSHTQVKPVQWRKLGMR